MGQRKKRFLYSLACFLLSILIVGSSVTSVSALSDYLRTIFSQNGLLFWNPDEKSGGCAYGDTSSSVTNTIILGDDNASSILGFLIQNGYSQNAAAAIAGNLFVESGLNPRKKQGGEIVDENFIIYLNGSKTFSGGIGLAQWTSDGRVKNLQDYANSKNISAVSLSAQLGFLLQEITGSYASSSSPSVLNSLSLEEAVFQIRRRYEGPAAMIYDTHDGYHYNDYVPNSYSDLDQTRTPGAYGEFLKAFNAAQSLLGVTPTTPTLNADKTAVCIPGTIDADSLVFYNQCDPQWGNLWFGIDGINGSKSPRATICDAGCGPTSFAVIATNLLHRSITPADTADVAGRANMYVSGAGSSHSITSVLSNHYSLQTTKISKSITDINSYLDRGFMIHTSGRGSVPFTSGGHYIAIVSHLPNGNWLIADSSKNGPSKEYEPSTVLNAGMWADNIWAVGVK